MTFSLDVTTYWMLNEQELFDSDVWHLLYSDAATSELERAKDTSYKPQIWCQIGVD